MSRRIALLGAGDLGRQLAHYLRSASDDVLVGFFDDTKSGDVHGAAVLGGMQDVVEAHSSGVFDAALMAIGYQHLGPRQLLFEQLTQAGVPFASFVHPSSYIDPAASLGAGSVVFPGCTVDMGASVGVNALINAGCVIAHDSHVGDHSFLGPAVQFAGFIHTGERCFLGLGTVVIDNIKLGPDTQTGGGTVVIKDCAGGALLVGNPAREVRRTRGD